MRHQKPEIVPEIEATKAVQKNQQGLALLVVLWMISIMLMISASLLYSVKIESGITHHNRSRAIIHAHSDAALRYSIQQLLLEKSQRQIKTLYKPFTWQFIESQAEVKIVAENGLIDLNQAPRALLQKLLLQQGLTEVESSSLLDRIADFKDKDDLVRLNGAEDQDYIEAGFPAGAKDAPFERIEELQQVLGMSVVLYQKLKKYLTVNAKSKGINPMLAPRHVLLLLADGDTDLVDDFIQQRDNTDETALTPLFGENFLSYTQSNRYRISIKISYEDNPPYFLEEHAIRLIKDKLPPFIRYSRNTIIIPT